MWSIESNIKHQYYKKYYVELIYLHSDLVERFTHRLESLNIRLSIIFKMVNAQMVIDLIKNILDHKLRTENLEKL